MPPGALPFEARLAGSVTLQLKVVTASDKHIANLINDGFGHFVCAE